MKTLEDLYYGNIVPHEHSFKRESAYSEVLSYVIRHQDSLIPTLTAKQKETFEKLKDCEAELHGMNEREAFISGFKLAAIIMTEVLFAETRPSRFRGLALRFSVRHSTVKICTAENKENSIPAKAPEYTLLAQKT